MPGNVQKKFRDEMTSEMKDTMRQCEEIRKSKDIAEDVKEKKIQELREIFEKKFEEAHNMPWYKESRQEHIRDIESRIKKEDKEEIMKKLAAAKNIDEKVKVFAKITDTFWLDAIISLIPWVWDAGMAIASTLFLVYQWKRIWLSWKEIWKIIWYQAIDFAIWSIWWTVVWTIVDYFFKSNKYSSKIFEDHVKKLEEAARAKWATDEEIAQLWKKEKEFLRKVETVIDVKDQIKIEKNSKQ